MYAFSDLLQIRSKFGHPVTSLPKFQGCPPGWVTCIATLPWITLLTLSVSIKLVSLSARVTSVKFTLGLVHSLLETTRHIDRTRRPGSDKNPNTRQLKVLLCWSIILLIITGGFGLINFGSINFRMKRGPAVDIQSIYTFTVDDIFRCASIS